MDNSTSFKAAILFDTGAHLSAVTAIVSCDCDDIDIDMTYRMCCLTVGDSPAYKAATLFDTGAHASFVNREVAARKEGQPRRNPSYLQKAREGQDQRCTTVSLAGTAYKYKNRRKAIDELRQQARQERS